jgi:voltage-dependent anion channel protein 2
VSTTVTGAGAASITAIATSLPVPGLRATATLPLPAVTAAKLGLAYAADAVNVAAGVSGLALGKPVFEVAATTGWQQLALGAELSGGPASSSSAPRWGATLAYLGEQSQVALAVSESGQLGTLSALHTVSHTTYVAVEVARRLDVEASKGATAGAARGASFTVGLQRKLASGALTKLKVDSSGVATGLYEQRVAADVALALTGQVDLANLGRPPAVGIMMKLV